MKFCCVPGCTSKAANNSKKLTFFNFPNERTRKGTFSPLKRRRRLEWIKAVGGQLTEGSSASKTSIKNYTVCSKHFVTGRPSHDYSKSHVDWVPTLNMSRTKPRRDDPIGRIIKSLPQVVEKYDKPEYVTFDTVSFNEKQIEMDIIQKYISNPVCDENGYYFDDHDYLGLPIQSTKTETPTDNPNGEHNYSLSARPACFYFDSRYFCNICRRNCTNLFTFNTHMTEHILRNDVICIICAHSCLTSNCLNSHMTIHTKLCRSCDKEVPSVQLKTHQWVNQKQKFAVDDICKYRVVDKKKIYFCVVCMNKFFTKKDYHSHSLLHKKVRL